MMIINSIDELIEAFKADRITDKQVIKILESQNTSIAIWVGNEGYNYSKEDTLKGLCNYKKRLESGNEMPFFFPYLSENEPDTFSFNDCLSRGKNKT